MTGRVLPYGPAAVLVEVADARHAAHLAAALTGQPGVGEVVPAHATVLVHLEPGGIDVDAIAHLAAAPPDEVGAGSEVVLDVPVVYDGEDVDAVARAAGCSPDEVVERHHRVVYQAAFCGFTPGFAYLVGLDPVLHVARRATPRTRVPAGAVAIAGPYSAVYPVASPGGWQLLGRTTEQVWAPDRDPPALLAPGQRVRFVPVRSR